MKASRIRMGGLGLCCFAVFSACRSARSGGDPPAATGAGVRPVRITIVGTSDIHGWVFPHESTLPNGVRVLEGGVATFAGYVANLRADNPGGTLLLDAGDLFQGTLATNLTEGAVVIDAYNRLGYQAVAIGNHEFDYGPEGPVSLALEPGMDPFGALKVRLRQAHFPMLAANIYDARTGGRPDWLTNDGTAWVEVKGLKVGILGLLTPTTPQTTNPINVRSLHFGSLVPEALSWAKNLRQRGADLLILLAHAGGKCTRWDNPKDLSSCRQDEEIFELLNNIPPRTFDAVIAGHTHQPIGHFINGMPVIESFGTGRYFGTIELFYDSTKRAVLTELTRITPLIHICPLVDEETKSCDPETLRAQRALHFVPSTFLGRRVVPDEDLAKALEPVRQKVAQEGLRRLGIKVAERLVRHYESESPLGDFITDSLREMERADVALLNAGGIRANIPAGDLTYGSVYEVLPFDNAVATMVVNGEQLARLVRAAYGAKKGVFQVSGLKVKLSQCPGPNRVKEISLSDGRPLVPEKLYRVVLPDFLVLGGDGMGSVISSLPRSRVDMGVTRELNFRDALVHFWQQKHEVIRPPSIGRLTFVPDETRCDLKADSLDER